MFGWYVISHTRVVHVLPAQPSGQAHENVPPPVSVHVPVPQGFGEHAFGAEQVGATPFHIPLAWHMREPEPLRLYPEPQLNMTESPKLPAPLLVTEPFVGALRVGHMFRVHWVSASPPHVPAAPHVWVYVVPGCQPVMQLYMRDDPNVVPLPPDRPMPVVSAVPPVSPGAAPQLTGLQLGWVPERVPLAWQVRVTLPTRLYPEVHE